MRRGTGESPLFLFTSGLLGLFVVSLPGLAGIAAALFRGQAAATAAGVLRAHRRGDVARAARVGVRRPDHPGRAGQGKA